MKKCVNVGGVGIWLDEIVPCLKDTEIGEIKETVVFRIESRSFLKKINEKNGWGINWIRIPKEVEVFALALKENNESRGLLEFEMMLMLGLRISIGLVLLRTITKIWQKFKNMLVLEVTFLLLQQTVLLLWGMMDLFMASPLTKRF
ncbi:hypothetical protein [Fibrobacter succinogenes]|uniref:hypothetical protein n=1 Tax=Fibrobacter succinogenes TaxID=833 RepID=UPI0026F05376|nr:hypothetical protein [Fibrobacter succinogenes]